MKIIFHCFYRFRIKITRFTYTYLHIVYFYKIHSLYLLRINFIINFFIGFIIFLIKFLILWVMILQYLKKACTDIFELTFALT